MLSFKDLIKDLLSSFEVLKIKYVLHIYLLLHENMNIGQYVRRYPHL